MEIAMPETNQTLTLENRLKCAMTGIKEVLSYSPAEITLDSSKGRIAITGSDLKITKYNEADGALSLTGKVNSIRYDEKKPPLIRRIFK